MGQSRLVRWNEVEAILKEPGDSLTVMNFWATWCKPCVAELPHFEKVRLEMKEQPIRFFYISLDFAEEQNKRLNPFISRKMPGARVWLLDESDYNQWINKIEASWSGAIPATLFFQQSTGKRIFASGEMSEDKLRHEIQSFFRLTKQ